MSPKQQRFVEEYLVDLNATAAAKRAGYSERTAEQQGHRLLRNVKVQQEIAKAQAKRAKRAGITAEWVVKRLVRNHNRAMQAEPVMDREGNPTGEYRYDGAVANKALELLGKHIAMFSDRLIHTAAPELPDVVRKALANADTSNILAVLSDRLSGVPPVPEPGGPGAGGLGGAMANGPAPVPAQSLPHSSRNGTH